MNTIADSDKKAKAPDCKPTANGAGLGSARDLITIRMVVFFGKLRKSTMLAHRREFGLSEVEWRIMTHVGAASPLSLNGLADLTLQDRGQLSRTVKGMVTRGILTRERKPKTTEIEIGLTAQGKQLYAELVDRVVRRDALLTDGLTKQDLETLDRITAAMDKHASKMLDEELALLSR